MDFLHGGGSGDVGVVILSRKGGPATEVKPHIQELLRLQRAEIREGMQVWLADLDGDISGKEGAPLAAIIRWHDTSGWRAVYALDDAESLD